MPSLFQTHYAMSTSALPLKLHETYFLSSVIASSYVAAVVLSNIFVTPKPPFWRDDPKVIKVRSALATLSSLFSCVVVWRIVMLFDKSKSTVSISTSTS